MISVLVVQRVFSYHEREILSDLMQWTHEITANIGAK